MISHPSRPRRHETQPRGAGDFSQPIRIEKCDPSREFAPELRDFRSFVAGLVLVKLMASPTRRPVLASGRQAHTSLHTGVEYGIADAVDAARKITVEVPEKLLERAQ